MNVAPLHGCCSSQWKLNLLRGVACVVRRTLASCQLSAPCAWLRRDPARRCNFVGSPAFRFGKMPGIVRCWPSSRSVHVEPEAVLLDRSADAARVVPLL